MLPTWHNYLITYNILNPFHCHPLPKHSECIKTPKSQQLRIKHCPYWSRFSPSSPEHQLRQANTDRKSFTKLQNQSKRKLQECSTLKKLWSSSQLTTMSQWIQYSFRSLLDTTDSLKSWNPPFTILKKPWRVSLSCLKNFKNFQTVFLTIKWVNYGHQKDSFHLNL